MPIEEENKDDQNENQKNRLLNINESIISENQNNNASILSGKNNTSNESGLFFVTNLVTFFSIFLINL